MNHSLKIVIIFTLIIVLLSSCQPVSETKQEITQITYIVPQWKGAFSSAPVNPEIGWTYYNTSTRKFYFYDGSKWQLLAWEGEKSITDSTSVHDGYLITWKGSLNTAPSKPEAGWAYYNALEKKSYIYDGIKWQILAQDGIDSTNTENSTDSSSNDTPSVNLQSLIYLGESTEIIDYVSYKVQTYVELQDTNPYFDSYHKYYYLNECLRRIYCFSHEKGSDLDYKYNEFIEHSCGNRTILYYLYTYYESGKLESYSIFYREGYVIKRSETYYYESGNKKSEFTYYDPLQSSTYEHTEIYYYENGNKKSEFYYYYAPSILYPYEHTETYYDENGNKKSSIIYYSSSDSTYEHSEIYYYENGKTKSSITYYAPSNSDSYEHTETYYYENGKTKSSITYYVSSNSDSYDYIETEYFES